MADLIAPTGSPFWLRLNGGAWVQLEGVTPGVGVDADRPRSEFRSVDGNRYVQRGPRGRRQWDLTIPYAASSSLTVGVLRAAAETDGDVWFASTDQLISNMLPAASTSATTLTGLPTVDCGGVSMVSFLANTVVKGRVRAGVATTLSCWTNRGAGASALSAVYPGGTRNIDSTGVGSRPSGTFTPNADGDVTITVSALTAGLMMTETAVLPPGFVHGEGGGMPCKVDVQDPGDTLTMRHDGYWRHAHQVTIREVG